MNVSPGMVGSKSKKEKHYSVEDLEKELETIKSISKEFNELRKKWRTALNSNL